MFDGVLVLTKFRTGGPRELGIGISLIPSYVTLVTQTRTRERSRKTGKTLASRSHKGVSTEVSRVPLTSFFALSRKVAKDSITYLSTCPWCSYFGAVEHPCLTLPSDSDKTDEVSRYGFA